MASTARIDELKKKFDENPRRYFAPLANEFRKAGDIEQAIMICEEFLPQQPGHMSGHIVYGQALFEAARFDEARTVFETALTLDPENLIALRHLGDIAKGQGDLDSARKWYDRVLEADPRNDEIQALIASLDGMPAPASEHAPVDLQAPVSPEEQRFAPPAIPQAPPAIPQAPPAIPQAPPAIPHAPPPLPEPIDLDIVGDLSTEMPATVPIQPSAPQAELPVERAEGLESVEFTPPSGPVDRAHDLGVDLQPSEFTAPAAPIAPMAGLEETAIGAFERVPDGGPPLPMLDTSEPMSPSAPTREEIPDVGPSTLEFEVPTASERAAVQGRAETATMPEIEAEGNSLPESRDARPTELPPELPPSVIAAEAELMDLGDATFETPARAEPAPVRAHVPLAPEEPAPVREIAPPPAREEAPPVRAATPQAPFVTETMAELFLKQGFREQALDVYRQLSAANPGDARLQQRVADLQPPAPAAVGDSVRDFLARLATLRPGERAAAEVPPSDDDFAAVEAAAYAEPMMPAPAAEAPRPTTPTSAMSTGLERGASTQASGGTIDALFGNRAPATSEDSAASALAQAFGGAPEPTPAITGRPARAAAGELSLDSVFRDGPPRPPRASQSFSFDQFFSPESAAPERAPAPPAPPAGETPTASEPAERSADDIEQFNSWLQGLKPK